MAVPLEFEKNIISLEHKLQELIKLAHSDDMNMSTEINRLKVKVDKQLKATYEKLDAWEKVQVARHIERPQFLDYVKLLIEDFVELSGDRAFGEDKAIIGGLGRFKGQSVVIMGHHKGYDTEGRIYHNFGMAKPEGYRKAKRLMRMANQFNLPLITLINTAGAAPTIEAEERGQSEAIAACLEVSGALEVPVVSVITGEGGSGGAIALGVANDVSMLEHSIYSVISPEGCASILWRTADKKQEAAEALRLTAQDLKKLGVIDRIIPEPVGGAHRHPKETISSVGDTIEKSLKKLCLMTPKALRQHRYEKFMEMGRTF